MRRKLADHDCWANRPLPDIGNTRTLLGNAEPIGTPGTPLPWKTAVPVPSVSLGNLPYPKTLPLVATGVKEIPPLAVICFGRALLLQDPDFSSDKFIL